MGRKKTDNQRDISIIVHLTEEEFEKLSKCAEQSLMPISTYIRRMALHMCKNGEVKK